MFKSAVIEETLRLVSGVSYRITRSAPTETLQLGEWTIPPNVRIHLKQAFNPLTISTDSIIHARPLNPPLRQSLSSAMVFHPRTLAHLPTTIFAFLPSTSAPWYPTSEPQIPGALLQRHSKLYRSTIGVCRTIHDLSECAEGVCNLGEG